MSRTALENAGTRDPQGFRESSTRRHTTPAAHATAGADHLANAKHNGRVDSVNQRPEHSRPESPAALLALFLAHRKTDHTTETPSQFSRVGWNILSALVRIDDGKSESLGVKPQISGGIRQGRSRTANSCGSRTIEGLA